MELMRGLSERPRLRKILIGTLIFLVLFTITGFFVAPPILKSVLTKKLSEKLHREVAIQKIKVNPFMLSVDIKGFVVKNREKSGTFISFDELYMNLQAASVWKGGPVLKEIKIDRPYVNVIRNEDGTYNFSDLLEEGKPKTASEAKPLRFSLNNIQIVNGSLDFLDGPKHTRHKARDVVINIPFISNLPHYIDTFVQPMFEAKLNDTLISFKGKTKPFTDSLETSFDVDMKDINIPYYLAYVPFKMNFKVLSGYVDTKGGVSYTQYRDKAPTLALTGNIAIKKIQVADEKDGRMIGLPLIEISIASSDLISQKVHLSRVFFQSPEISLFRDKAGKMNLEALLPKDTAGKKDTVGKKEDSKTKSITIDADEIKVAGGKISFSDLLKANTFSTTLENIDLTIAHFSNSPNKKTAVELALQTEAKETLKLAGDFSFSPMTAEGTVELKGLPIRKYSPYFSENVLFDVEGAQLDVQTRYSFSKKGEEPEVRLSGLAADLNSLRLKKRGEKEDFLKIPLVSIKETDADVSKKELVVGSFSTQKGLAIIKRFNNGKLNVEDLLPPAPPQKEKPPKAKKGQVEKPWQILVKDFALEGYTVKVEDLVPHQPVALTVEKIRVTGKNISTAKNSKGKVSASLLLNKKGSFTTNGTVSLNPLAANMKLNAKGMDVVPFQPYFTDRVKIILTEGAFSANGNLSLAFAKEAGPKVTYNGEASITSFSSLDKANAEDFLKWNSLHFGGIDAGFNPMFINIKDIALTDFYSRLIINPDGSLNVQGIVEEEAPKTAGPAPIKTPPPIEADKKTTTAKKIKIESLTLQGGKINFSDNHIQPNYSANLIEIGGRISGLSSEEDKFADVDVKGKLDNYAPLEITGKINPLSEDLYVDIKVDFKDMDLSPVTPYSGRYMGYIIQKGKLALHLQYLIVKKKLDSQNTIFLDQFTLGDKVDSPDATKLPVRLAIALLKNRKGEIKLDIPVTGYINDPKFSLGRIILKIIVNLLAKAATSPFALLGAILGGGGEELSYIDFGYGSIDINAEEEKKIDKLVKALSDRPALKLEIEGHVDIEKDREGLREYLFNKKIKAQKLKEMVKKGLTTVPVDEVKVEKEEYPKFLKMAYKQEKFPKPRNVIGIAKDLPVPEMEKLMLTNIEVKNDDLRLLASQRALKVKDRILKSNQVEPERVFLVEPKSLSPEKKEKLRDSRVDFRLK
jgi:uncharacterized protein involved in outer membrane biogenesis